MTIIEEGVIGKGGPCHCGKVGLYAVPQRGRNTCNFYCEDHREQANTAMRKHHEIKQDMRQSWSNAAGEFESERNRRDLSIQQHEPYVSGKGKNLKHK